MKVEADFANDIALPQLPTVLDADAMRKTFQAHLFKGNARFQIQDCRIQRVKYKPGLNCMVCYQLEIMDTEKKVLVEQQLCARIYELGGSVSRFMKALSVETVSPKFGLPISHLPRLEMVVWAFPNDRKLHGMHKIADPDFLKDKLLPQYFKGRHITDLTVKLVHYVPEHTCTVRVVLQLSDSQTGKRREVSLYGKTYYNDEGRDVFKWMKTLWQSPSRSSGRLKMAQVIGYDEATKSLWQTGLCGMPLLEVEMETSQFTDLLREAASTVASLHTTAIPGLRLVSVSDLLNQMERVKDLLMQCRPALKEALFPLVERLKAQAENFGSDKMATLHGDLHLNNFFVEDEKIALIDMDNLTQAPPLLDIGSFLAGLFYRGFLCDTPNRDISDMAQVFIEQYEKSVPWSISQSSLRWYTAMMLINERAFRCLTRLKAGRLDILDQLILLADRMTLEKGGNLFTAPGRGNK